MVKLDNRLKSQFEIFENWLNFCSIEDIVSKIPSAQIYENFTVWCELRGEANALSKIKLSSMLQGRGFTLHKGTAGQRMIKGIRLYSKEEIMANNNGNMIPGYEMKDNFACISPDDSRLWLELFIMADRKSRELCEILQYIRNTGAKMVRNPTYGYIIRPVIGAFGWSSMAEYEKEKKYLSKHKAVVVELLMELAKGGKRK